MTEFLVVFLSQDSDTARTSGLTEYTKAVNKTNLGRRLQMLTCMKPRLLRLQKSTNESAWGMGTAGPARHCRAWINLYVTRGTEEDLDKGMAKGYKNWSSGAFGTESRRSRFLGVEE